jgi:hypothetical protein
MSSHLLQVAVGISLRMHALLNAGRLDAADACKHTAGLKPCL